MWRKSGKEKKCNELATRICLALGAEKLKEFRIINNEYSVKGRIQHRPWTS